MMDDGWEKLKANLIVEYLTNLKLLCSQLSRFISRNVMQIGCNLFFAFVGGILER